MIGGDAGVATDGVPGAGEGRGESELPQAATASPSASAPARASIPRAEGLCARSSRDVDAVLLMSRPIDPDPEGREPQSGPKAREPRGASRASPPLEGGLYVVATPIGNLRDITLRALDVLGGADLVLAEDTRVARKLLDAFSLAPQVTSYHEHNAESARPKVLAALAAGKTVALISDAGTPLISDPGYKLVRDAAAAGHRVFPIPGASALLSGLVVAGLPTDRFLFAGFAPSKAGARATFFDELADISATLVFYETGPRLKASLEAMHAAFGDREAAVGRELTKFFEEVRRGRLSALAAAIDVDPKGEIVVVVAPPEEKPVGDEAALDAALRRFLPSHPVKEAARLAAEETGVMRRDAYARALILKDQA